MNHFTKKILFVLVLFCAAQFVMADKGIGKKTKNKVVLNISTPLNLKNSIPLNLRSGLSYKGSLLSSTNKATVGSTLVTSSLISYQKGNTTYLIPYRHRITSLPEVKPGYTGMKIILRSR